MIRARIRGVATAIFPGTFDPVTLGHVDLVRRGRALFPKVIVAVGVRGDKTTLFSSKERVALLADAVADLDGVTVLPFSGLIVDFARAQGATVLLRGVRNPSDVEYEAQMAHTNRHLAPGLEPVLLVPTLETGFISSTLIKEIVKAGGDASAFVPKNVAAALRGKC